MFVRWMTFLAGPVVVLGLVALASLVAQPYGAAFAGAAQERGSLQPMIDAAKPGDLITPPPGRYQGGIIITKPLTLDGRGKVIIDAGGKGSVIILKTDGATVKNLHLTNSGDQHNDLDSGVQVRGNFNVVKDNVIDESLFGVDLQQSNSNVVRRNKISSKSDNSLGLKGDAIRLWYSRSNKIEKNIIRNSRDMVVWYSADNIIANNEVANGRYGMHFMYSKYNLVEGNTFNKNAVGIFVMYSDSLVIRKNRVFQAQGAAGVGIGFKEASNCDVIENEVLYNSTGLYLDLSPFQPDTTNRIYRNTVAYNDIGVLFLNDWTGNLLKDNIFASNSHHASVSTFAGAARNVWLGNYWDSYEGFDQNKDGIGDKPYRLKVFADRIWMDVKETAFFRGAPVLTMLDFLERLAPFTKPLLMLEDKKPRTSRLFKFDTLAESKTDGNAGRTLETFGAITSSSDRSGTSLKRLDPFGLDKD